MMMIMIFMVVMMVMLMIMGATTSLMVVIMIMVMSVIVPISMVMPMKVVVVMIKIFLFVPFLTSAIFTHYSISIDLIKNSFPLISLTFLDEHDEHLKSGMSRVVFVPQSLQRMTAF